MNNLLYLYLVEAERRRDRLAKAAHYRLINQVKQQKNMVGKPLLRSSINHLLET